MIKKLILIIFLALYSPLSVLANFNQDSYAYKVVDTDFTALENKDPLKVAKEKNKIDNQFLYGYKLSTGRFFITPEVGKQNFAVQNTQIENNNFNPNFRFALKTSLGYDFNNHFSAFIGYNLGGLAFDKEQMAGKVKLNHLQLGSITVGSQINITQNFGVKINCLQQNSIINSNNQQNIVGCNNVKIGTVYGF
ncbi:MAG: acyloxyacyl hydrolase [Rickettsiales bacterium]|nr:acyloxyacyl hydrolase [Rickettsiales bacterium]